MRTQKSLLYLSSVLLAFSSQFMWCSVKGRIDQFPERFALAFLVLWIGLTWLAKMMGSNKQQEKFVFASLFLSAGSLFFLTPSELGHFNYIILLVHGFFGLYYFARIFNVEGLLKWFEMLQSWSGDLFSPPFEIKTELGENGTTLRINISLFNNQELSPYQRKRLVTRLIALATCYRNVPYFHIEGDIDNAQISYDIKLIEKWKEKIAKAKE